MKSHFMQQLCLLFNEAADSSVQSQLVTSGSFWSPSAKFFKHLGDSMEYVQEDFLQTVKQFLLCLVGLSDKQLLETDLIKKTKRV